MTPPPAPAILIVAPPTLQRQGLVATLRDARPDFDLQATADLPTLPDRLLADTPALIILDSHLKGQPFDCLIAQIQTCRPGQRMLVLGGRRLSFRLSRLIVELGGGMLLTNRATPQDLLAAVDRLLEGPAPAASAKPLTDDALRPAPPHPASGFSQRELDVLYLVAADYSTQEIAARLHISVRTVDAHRRTLIEKARARSIVGVVLEAFRQGWLELV